VGDFGFLVVDRLTFFFVVVFLVPLLLDAVLRVFRFLGVVTVAIMLLLCEKSKMSNAIEHYKHLKTSSKHQETQK
jgi:hypothetical protein